MTETASSGRANGHPDLSLPPARARPTPALRTKTKPRLRHRPPELANRTLTSNRWLVLVIACLAQFMVVLDATIVNVALPSIQHGLHFSAANLPWVVNAYTLIFGGFLLLGGRAADLLGRKRLFVAGVVLFSAASLLNGLAQSSAMLIAGPRPAGPRRRAGLPAALSIITTTFTDRRRAHQGARRLERDRGRWRRRRPAARRRADRRWRPGAGSSSSTSRSAIVTVALALRYVPESRAQTGASVVRPRRRGDRHRGLVAAGLRDHQGPDASAGARPGRSGWSPSPSRCWPRSWRSSAGAPPRWSA